jgi:hypothetical protein
MTDREKAAQLADEIQSMHGNTPGNVEEAKKQCDVQNISLDGGGNAKLEEGLIKVYNTEGQFVFSIDQSSFPFEKKPLIALGQCYYIGRNTGSQEERRRLQNKLVQAHNLIFG